MQRNNPQSAGATLVVKFGGSLLNSPHLPAWLQCLGHLSPRLGIILVPGGGVFAEPIRSAQARWRFTAGTAHRMALFSMAQYGLLLGEYLSRRFTPEEAMAGLQGAVRRQRSVIWLPGRIAPGPPQLPADWSATADSIGLWLAKTLGVPRYALIKAAPLSLSGRGPYRCLDGMARPEAFPKALLDEHFATAQGDYNGSIHLFGGEEYCAFERFAAVSPSA